MFGTIIAEQLQRANPLSAPRVEMNVGTGNTSYISIHQLKREVDSYKQRQQEIVSFDQVNYKIECELKYNLTLFLIKFFFFQRILWHVKINKRWAYKWIHFCLV